MDYEGLPGVEVESTAAVRSIAGATAGCQAMLIPYPKQFAPLYGNAQGKAQGKVQGKVQGKAQGKA